MKTPISEVVARAASDLIDSEQSHTIKHLKATDRIAVYREIKAWAELKEEEAVEHEFLEAHSGATL